LFKNEDAQSSGKHNFESKQAEAENAESGFSAPPMTASNSGFALPDGRCGILAALPELSQAGLQPVDNFTCLDAALDGL
jgi:hypothetical protein